MDSVGVLHKWIGEKKADYISNYKAMGLKASGSLETNTDVELSADGGLIKTPKYVGGLLYGRSPNKNQSPEALKAWVSWAGSTFLKQWVKDKGLSINSYAVAWSIARKGWNVPNAHNTGELYSKVFNEKAFEDLRKDIGSQWALDIQQQTKKIWLQ